LSVIENYIPLNKSFIFSALASDHDRLQNLHQMLSSDYDRVITLQKKLKGEKVEKAQFNILFKNYFLVSK